jgi:hypothetical protein
MYQQRVTIHPKSDSVGAARTLLSARVKASQARGQQIALAELIAGRHTPEFQVIALYPDLAAFEAQRKRNQADPAFQKFGAKLATLLRDPVGIDLFEVLVVMPGLQSSPAGGGARRKAKK